MKNKVWPYYLGLLIYDILFYIGLFYLIKYLFILFGGN